MKEEEPKKAKKEKSKEEQLDEESNKMEEWEDDMYDFVPDNMLTIEVYP